MEGCHCDVIGCSGRACWKMRQPPDAYSDEYLCHAHWELLRGDDRRRAAYAHLSMLLTEGMESCLDQDARCVVLDGVSPRELAKQIAQDYWRKQGLIKRR